MEERGGVHERLAAGDFVDLVDAGGHGKLDDDLIDVSQCTCGEVQNALTYNK